MATTGGEAAGGDIGTGGTTVITACSTGTAQAGDVTVSVFSPQQKISGFGVSSAWAGSFRDPDNDPDMLRSTETGAWLTLHRIRIAGGTTSETRIAQKAVEYGVNAPPPFDDPTLDGYADDNNAGAWGKCGPGCRTRGPFCGDGEVQRGEQCDDGFNLSQYGGCAPGCADGPYCGDDSVQSPFEECDDGINDGSYNGCGANCALGPYCRDGQLQENAGEICDDGNSTSDDGCTGSRPDVIR